MISHFFPRWDSKFNLLSSYAKETWIKIKNYLVRLFSTSTFINSKSHNNIGRHLKRSSTLKMKIPHKTSTILDFCTGDDLFQCHPPCLKSVLPHSKSASLCEVTFALMRPCLNVFLMFRISLWFILHSQKQLRNLPISKFDIMLRWFWNFNNKNTTDD